MENTQNTKIVTSTEMLNIWNIERGKKLPSCS